MVSAFFFAENLGNKQGCQMILVFGSINVDLVARVPHIAKPGETVLSPTYETFCGGKGANQAVAAARALPKGEAGVAMVGAVGHDAFGAHCLDNFASAGVDTSAVQRCAAPTGVAFVAVDAAAENAIIVASGANLELRAKMVPSALLESIRIAIFQMEVPLAENLALARRLPAATRIILNFAPALTDTDAASLTEMIALTDILVVNEHEAEVVGQLRIDGNDRPEALAIALGFDLVVTRGGEGVDIYDRSGVRQFCPAPRVQVVDTTGAGDTFVGTLGARLSAGWSLHDAIVSATDAASLACTHFGAQVDVFAAT